MCQWKCEKQCESAAPLGLNLISLLWFSTCTQVSVNTQVSFCALAFRRNPSDILGHWKWTVWNKGWRCSETPLSVFTSGQAEADIFGNDDTDTRELLKNVNSECVCVCVMILWSTWVCTLTGWSSVWWRHRLTLITQLTKSASDCTRFNWTLCILHLYKPVLNSWSYFCISW